MECDDRMVTIVANFTTETLSAQILNIFSTNPLPHRHGRDLNIKRPLWFFSRPSPSGIMVSIIIKIIIYNRHTHTAQWTKIFLLVSFSTHSIVKHIKILQRRIDAYRMWTNNIFKIFFSRSLCERFYWKQFFSSFPRKRFKFKLYKSARCAHIYSLWLPRVSMVHETGARCCICIFIAVEYISCANSMPKDRIFGNTYCCCWCISMWCVRLYTVRRTSTYERRRRETRKKKCELMRTPYTGTLMCATIQLTMFSF